MFFCLENFCSKWFWRHPTALFLIKISDLGYNVSLSKSKVKGDCFFQPSGPKCAKKKVLRRLSRNRLWLWFPIDFLIFFSKIFFCNFFFRQNFRKISFKDFDISSIKIFYNDFFRIFFFKKYFFFWPKIDQPSITPVAS